MKKILALLLALVMALGCVGAFAEEPTIEEPTIEEPAIEEPAVEEPAVEETAVEEPAIEEPAIEETAIEETKFEIPEFDIPAFTVTWESTADIEAINALLPMLVADDSYVTSIMQAVLPLLAETSAKVVFADNGLQIDLGLKGETILTVAGEKVEGGYALASDILPSYVITLADETIESMIEQYTAQMEETLGNVDMEALAGSVTNYAMEFVNACSAAVTFGDAEMGEFPFEDLGLTFNCRMPINIDMAAIKDAIFNLITEIKNDEAIGALLNSLGPTALPIDVSEDTEFVIPEVTAYAYSNVDEEGNSVDGITLVDVAATAEGETVNVTVIVEEAGVTVNVDVPSQETYVSVFFTGAEDGFSASFSVYSMGMQAMEVFAVSIGEAVTVYSETYFMDMANPIEIQTLVFSWGGERTFPVLDENKTVIGVEQLMADTEGQVSGALMADVMSNGLGNLIAKVSQIMPDEMVSVMNLFYGTGTEAVEGAAE